MNEKAYLIVHRVPVVGQHSVDFGIDFALELFH